MEVLEQIGGGWAVERDSVSEKELAASHKGHSTNTDLVSLQKENFNAVMCSQDEKKKKQRVPTTSN